MQDLISKEFFLFSSLLALVIYLGG